MDESLYFILAFAKKTLFFAAKLMLYLSPLFGREDREIILWNFEQIYQTTGLDVLPLGWYQCPLWHHQGVISQVCVLGHR